MSIEPVFAITATIAGFAWLVWRLFWPRRSADEPGPHNDWRRTDRRGTDTSFGGSGAADVGGFDSGGG